MSPPIRVSGSQRSEESVEWLRKSRPLWSYSYLYPIPKSQKFLCYPLEEVEQTSRTRLEPVFVEPIALGGQRIATTETGPTDNGQQVSEKAAKIALRYRFEVLFTFLERWCIGQERDRYTS